MTQWPMERVPVSEIESFYIKGAVGAYHSQRQKELLLDEVKEPDGEALAYKYGIVGTGAGKLSIPYKFAIEHWPNCWPCPGQETGDCVGHAGKNIGLVTIGVEAVLDKPDEITNLMEGWPIVTARAEKQGVVMCENFYGERGHRGQGASCYRLIRYGMNDGGIMLRMDYPSLGMDFTDYDVDTSIRWGGTKQGTPTEVDKIGAEHQYREATECKNHEVVRDMVAMGFPIWVCSSLGWSNKRDENGYSKKSGSWNHSWIIAGYDDRSETIKRYGFPLALFIHDWGRFNSGGTRILGTQYDIPEGTMWIDARLLDRCECSAIGGFTSWESRKKLNYETGVF